VSGRLGFLLILLGSAAAVAVLSAGPARSEPAGAGVLKPGTHKTSQFRPTLTYTVPAGWENFCDSPGDVCFTPPGGDPSGVDSGKSDFLDVFASVAVSAGSGCPRDRPGAIHTPNGFVRWLQHVNGLVVSRPAKVTIGGLRGYVVDVRMRKGWTRVCPGLDPPAFIETLTGRPPSPRDLSHGIGPQPQVERLYLLNYKGGTLEIEHYARNGSTRLSAYSKVVSTFRFAA
jgi:hypothetical protein